MCVLGSVLARSRCSMYGSCYLLLSVVITPLVASLPFLLCLPSAWRMPRPVPPASGLQQMECTPPAQTPPATAGVLNWPPGGALMVAGRPSAPLTWPSLVGSLFPGNPPAAGCGLSQHPTNWSGSPRAPRGCRGPRGGCPFQGSQYRPCLAAGSCPSAKPPEN